MEVDLLSQTSRRVRHGNLPVFKYTQFGKESYLFSETYLWEDYRLSLREVYVSN